MAAVGMKRLLFFKSWLDLTYENTSLAIQYTSLSVILLYFIGFIPSVYKVLAVTPGFLIPPNFRIWTLLTGGLIETRILYVAIDIAVLLLCGRQLEPLWGALELLKFLAILDVFASVSTTILCLVAYVSVQNTSVWFATFSGMAGVIGGVSVAFKQIMPDQKISLRFTSVRVERVPSILITISCILATIGVLPVANPLLLMSGIIIGWIYLRFYQPRGKGIKGDMNDHFVFASFFPAYIRSPVEKVSVICFNVMIRIGICKTPVRTYDVGAPSAITISLPGMSPSDAERRRRKALRALNERLKREQQNPEQQDGENWPTIDDDRKENEEIAEETNQTRDDTQDFDNDTIDVLSKKGKDEQ